MCGPARAQAAERPRGLAAACTSTPGWGASSRHTGATAAVEGRCELQVLNRGEPADGLTARQVLIESFRTCERAALTDLDAIAGRRSLCSLSREGATVPAAKYHEGAAAGRGSPGHRSAGGGLRRGAVSTCGAPGRSHSVADSAPNAWANGPGLDRLPHRWAGCVGADDRRRWRT